MSKNNNLPLFYLISAALTAPLLISSAQAAGFWDDSHLTGGIYYSQRYRDKRDMTPGSATYGDYVEDLHHATFNANLDFTSG